VGDAIRQNGILKGLGYQVLAHHVIKCLGAIFAGDDLVRHKLKSSFVLGQLSVAGTSTQHSGSIIEQRTQQASNSTTH
jgi:hypothetical protein